jgi:hypothetical protein
MHNTSVEQCRAIILVIRAFNNARVVYKPGANCGELDYGGVLFWSDGLPACVKLSCGADVQSVHG